MFKYPRLSWFWCAVLVVFVLTFDPRYLLSYLIAVITIVYGLYMPQVARVINPYLNKLFFDHPNIYYKQVVKIATSSQISVIEAKKQLTEKYTPKDKNSSSSGADKKNGSEKAVKQATKSLGSEKDDFEVESNLGFDEAQMKKATNKGSRWEKIKEIRRIIGAVNYEIGWYFDLIEKIYKVFSW